MYFTSGIVIPWDKNVDIQNALKVAENIVQNEFCCFSIKNLPKCISFYEFFLGRSYSNLIINAGEFMYVAIRT